MAKFVFTGDYQTNVSLPDGSVVLVEPGESVDLDFDEPGPMWAGSRTTVGKAAKAAAPDAPPEVPTPATPAIAPESEQS